MSDPPVSTVERGAPLRPSRVRERILGEHQVLRQQLERLDDVVRVALERDAEVVQQVAELTTAFLAQLRSHIDLEDALLCPTLRETDIWGPRRAESMERHHKEQRRDLEAILAECCDPDVTAGALARRLRDLVADVRNDMLYEEKEYLNKDILADTLVTLDADSE